MTTTMNPNQRLVLNYMDIEQIGAFYFEGGWVWKEDIRKDVELAERVAWSRRPSIEVTVK